MFVSPKRLIFFFCCTHKVLQNFIAASVCSDISGVDKPFPTMFDLVPVSPRSFFVPSPPPSPETSSRCFFFRSKSGRAERRLRAASSRILPRYPLVNESRGRLSEFGLIRRSAGCPAFIRKPFCRNPGSLFPADSSKVIVARRNRRSKKSHFSGITF